MMKSFLFALDQTSREPMYQQIYQFLRQGIMSEEIPQGEKLPSLREGARALGVSLTTVNLAYSQLAMEGYVQNHPKSGFYVSALGPSRNLPSEGAATLDPFLSFSEPKVLADGLYIDPDCFDFLKWKKCLNQIYTDFPHLLLSEGDPQGEWVLRNEISRYAYQHRGVKCTREQIVIGAGISPIIDFLSVILKKQEIRHLAIENPGFPAVERIFADRDFAVLPIPVDSDGMRISVLPTSPNQKSIVYVSPSNQFPLGSVMPVGKRYALLEWAHQSGNYILEDDYDSELRYYGKPIPALQGLDQGGRVVYLGSFSATLFPSIKISYMILPDSLLALARSSMDGYRQTCSKSEQLTLALYMNNGLYQTHIKKLRRLYAQKMQKATEAVRRHLGSGVRILQSTSGVHMLLSVESSQTISELCERAQAERILITPVTYFAGARDSGDSNILMFYYSRIPLEEIEPAILRLALAWNS
jgi:GntR family transcriptional regulator / MocR family aminotransferase